MLEFSHLKSFTCSDAPAVSHLFKLVYGENYVYPEVYQSDTFCTNHANKTWESVLAISTDEQIIGHGLLWTHPHCPHIPEMGLFVVHPDARNLGLAKKISLELIEIAKKNGVVGIGTKQVCNHPFSQKLGKSLGFLNLSFWPDYISSPFVSDETRESILCAYLPLRTEPKKILFLPDELIPNAESLTNGVDKIETIMSSTPTQLQAYATMEVTQLETDITELYLHNWGADGAQKLATIDQEKLTFMLVNAELPANTLACEHLLLAGFSFMGLIPDRFDAWTWVFAKNFSLDAASYIIDERINRLIKSVQEQLSINQIIQSIYEPA